MNNDEEKFWKEWVTDLKDEVETFKKLARERGELNVKLSLQLERLKALGKRAENGRERWVDMHSVW